VAAKVGLIEALLGVLEVLSKTDTEALTAVLSSLKAFLGSYPTRDQFWSKRGPALLTELASNLEGQASSLPAPTFVEKYTLLVARLKLAF
jgi:hypothetical protein